MKTWPAPNPGDEFGYETVAKLIGCPSTDRRFWTVTKNWRRRWLDKGIVIECDPNRAFYVANLKEVSSRSYDVLRSIGRKARTQRKKLVVQKPQDDQERSTIEHQARLMAGLEREARKSRLNILPSTSVADVPKIAPPKRDVNDR
jgi:hypothetical protein